MQDNGVVVVNENGVLYGRWLLWFLGVCSMIRAQGVKWIGGYVTIGNVQYRLKGVSVEDIGEEVNSILCSGGKNVSTICVEIWFWGEKPNTSYSTLLLGEWFDDGCFRIRKL